MDNNRLVSFLLNDLSQKDHQEMQREIQASPDLQKELEDLKLVLGHFDQMPEAEPSTYLRDQFYQFLTMESKKQESGSRFAFRVQWRVAAAIALLAIGIGFGVIWQNHNRQQEQIRQLSEEVVETRKLLLLAMLEDPSASERIKAMNASASDFNQDQRVVDALINRLQYDENVNVRLKAAEALGAFMQREDVARAAIQALEKDTSPEVQIMLIESLVRGERKEAVPTFRRLLDREDLSKVVRDLAAYGLETLI